MSEAVPRDSARKAVHQPNNSSNQDDTTTPIGWVLGFFSALFAYRKTSLTFFTFVTLVFTYGLFAIDSSLDLSVDLPNNEFEYAVLENAWLNLQVIGKNEHPYASVANDRVHDYIKEVIELHISYSSFIELDTDVGNDILYAPSKGHLAYYESNNLVVRINGTNKNLPALLVSAHYDSVPTAYGITDDGMGIASMLGFVEFYAKNSGKQPERTIILNFNNDEEFGLFGATSFVLAHPWFKQIKYFINLEGTGAGGKCVLFRGTDYGITKFFKNVRYPFGTSLYQQGFNNRLIHSETDYIIYKEDGGIRGIDLAFYRPRDIYHTASDNIRNIDKKSLWNMLSNAIDFSEAIVRSKIDLDDEYDVNVAEDSSEIEVPSFDNSRSFAAYGSLLNYFFVFPITSLVIVNTILLIAIPLVSLPLLLIVFYYRESWSINFVNFSKLPLSLFVSVSILNLLVKYFRLVNEFLPNNGYMTLILTSFGIFGLTNYAFLNLYNYVFYQCKIHDHDEKLINILQVSFIYWVLLIISTIKLAYNKIGDDHTGEFPLTALLVLQSLGGLLGIFGFLFKANDSRKNYSYEFIHEDEQQRPLLGDSEADGNNYGSSDAARNGADIVAPSSSSSILLPESVLNATEESLKPKKKKTYSYEWSLQFLVIVPLSSFIVYNIGILCVDGVNKSIQESLISEVFIYDSIKYLAVFWFLPFISFIYKINKFGIYSLIILVSYGLLLIHTTKPFDELNPLKLRFIQNLDLTTGNSVIDVYSRIGTPFETALSDLPSIKESGEKLICSDAGDGMGVCSFNSTLQPKLIPNAASYNEYLNISILKNSLNEPFGLLTGEFKINAPKNRLCTLDFKQGGALTKQLPVKTVVIYNDKKSSNKSLISSELSIPKGFSKDQDGNFFFKDFDGISDIQLNKLDWDSSFHIGFQWVPSIDELSQDVEISRINKLSVNVKCFWGDLEPYSDSDGEVIERIPAYNEFLHYSPNYITWANREEGLVTASKTFDI